MYNPHHDGDDDIYRAAYKKGMDNGCMIFIGIVIIAGLINLGVVSVKNRHAQNKEIHNYKNNLPNYNDSIKNATDTAQLRDYMKKRDMVERQLQQFKDSVRGK